MPTQMIHHPTFSPLTSLNRSKTHLRIFKRGETTPIYYLLLPLHLSTTCSYRCTLKGADFIGAYLQAKVIGRHFVKLPVEYAYHLPHYFKYFGAPLLLNKGTYGLV